MDCVNVAAQAESRADPATVFRLLKDGSTWTDWAKFDSFELERPGQHETYGVGAIRVLSSKLTRAREEIVEVVPDRRVSYVLLSGLPLRAYHAEVELASAANGGTVIRWRAAFYPQHVVMGWFWRRFMTWVLATLVRRLALAAERLRTSERTT